MSSQQRTTRNATPRARVPGIVLPKAGSPDQHRFNEAVKEWIELREGARGTPFERVVTVRDLYEEIDNRRLVSAPQQPGVIVSGGTSGVAVQPFDAFYEGLRNTQLWREVTGKIDDPKRFDNLHQLVKQELLSELAPITGQAGAAIERFEKVIKNNHESVALQVTRLRASVARAAAGVRQVSFASASANRATAGVVTQITARLDNFTGGAPGTATVESKMTAIADRATGLEAQVVFKVATNGAAAGLGLAATTSAEGNSTSHVIIMGDKFAVVGSGDTLLGSGTPADPYTPPANRVPFGVDTVNSTIYINGHVRINSGTGVKVTAVGKRVVLTAPIDTFLVGRSGTASPTSILLSATLMNGLTGSTSWSVITGTATLTGSGDTRTLSYSNMTSDAVAVEVSVTDDGVTYTDRISIFKSYNGVRGSTSGNGLFYGISSTSWTDAKANRVISNIVNNESLTTDLASSSLNRIGDAVTLGNGTSFSQTKYWNGSAWTVPGVIINGDLMVDGTIAATKLNVTTLSAITANLGTVTAGAITGTASLDITGNAEFGGAGTADSQTWAVVANTSGNADGGVIGYAFTSGGSGLYGNAVGAGTIGVKASGVFGGLGIEIFGGLSFLSGDITVASGKFSTASAGTATFGGTKPNGSTSNQWMEVYKGATKGWVPWWPDA